MLTGAGVSTDSGIPDYRGPETARRARNPIRFAEFVRDEVGRQRYWARSFVGWPRLARARPNPAHHALARMQRDGRLAGLITQNVDRLHRTAGSSGEVELHGALADVICLGCGTLSSRSALQSRLASLNPDWRPEGEAAQAPDGDADVEHTRSFRVARCTACGGDLKPHVVFFGESVPRERVARARSFVDDADALVVAGSSLVVYSGLRFVKQAHQRGIPIVLVNLGPTRGDPLATLKVEGNAGEVLGALAR